MTALGANKNLQARESYNIGCLHASESKITEFLECSTRKPEKCERALRHACIRVLHVYDVTSKREALAVLKFNFTNSKKDRDGCLIDARDSQFRVLIDRKYISEKSLKKAKVEP
jgi:hypothetical protein